jgi:hypothetical protein
MISLLYTGRNKKALIQHTTSQETRDIWYTLFNLRPIPDNAPDEQKQFAFSIKTDGFAVSIHYSTVRAQLSKNQKSSQRLEARENIREANQGMTETELDTDRAVRANSAQDAKRQKLDESTHAQRAYAENALPRRKTIDGIPYACDMTDDEQAAIDGRVSVGIDPGRRDLLHMIGDMNADAVRLSPTYSNKQYVHKSGRLRHMQRSAGHSKRKTMNIKNAEENFVGNKKSTTVEGAQGFLSEWANVNHLSTM